MRSSFSRVYYYVLIRFLILVICMSVSIKQAYTQLPALKTAVAALEQDADLQSANWSITVLDAGSGALLLGHHSSKSLPTASTMKVLTTATALALLGPEYRFATRLEYSGKISDTGVLEGDLYLRGSGDPTLGSDRFGDSIRVGQILARWVEAIKAAGIQRIAGKVIGDASAFSTQLTPGNWGWEDMGNYYGAGASGLNFLENEYTLYLKPGAREGSQAEIVSTQPPMDELEFINELGTGSPGSGDQAYIFGSPYTSVRYVRGTIPAGKSSFSIRGSLPDPALVCARMLREQLLVCGIAVHGGASTLRQESLKGLALTQRHLLYLHESPPLREIIIPLNLKSINLYAEALLKAIALKAGKGGSTDEGVEAMEAYWKSQGVDTKGMFLRDGSGLSGNNCMSTLHLASVLAKAHQASYSSFLKESLPVAGRSGSLSNMLRGTAAEGKLMAKSGYISSTRAYAGYCPLSSGKYLAFSMIANNYSCSDGQMRRKLERLMAVMASEK